MKWIKTSELKPPFGYWVLGWKICPLCLSEGSDYHEHKQEEFPDNLSPSQGPFYTAYFPPLDGIEEEEGKFWEKFKSNYWAYQEPDYWMWIEKPPADTSWYVLPPEYEGLV